MGSSLSGLAISSEKASHMQICAPAEPPKAAMRSLSMFQSKALERISCRARRASWWGVGNGVAMDMYR